MAAATMRGIPSGKFEQYSKFWVKRVVSPAAGRASRRAGRSLRGSNKIDLTRSDRSIGRPIDRRTDVFLRTIGTQPAAAATTATTTTTTTTTTATTTTATCAGNTEPGIALGETRFRGWRKTFVANELAHRRSGIVAFTT